MTESSDIFAPAAVTADALRALMLAVDTLPTAIACAEGAAALLMLDSDGQETDETTRTLTDLCWEAGELARHAYPESELIATAWARTLCHLTAAYGSRDLLQQTFRCQEARTAIATQFPFSEGVQYWNAQANFEMVTLLARRGYLKSIPIYLDNLRTFSRSWPDRPAFSALYAMALSNAAIAHAQLQQLPPAREQVDDLRRLAVETPGEEIRQAYARGLQQVAWYCGELVAPETLHGWALELAALLPARAIQYEYGSRTIAELGVYSAYFARRGDLSYAADTLREACRWIDAIALKAEEIPMIVGTFREAAYMLREVEPELARLAEARAARLLV